MKSYTVMAPVAYASGGKGVTCFKVGNVVEVDDEQAKGLVADGKLEPVKSAAEQKDKS